MVKALLVPKKFNTYADTFLMLGLAQLAESALRETGQKTEMQLINEGRCYRIEFKKTANLEAMAKLDYFNPFLPVCGAKTDRSKIPAEASIFDTVKEGEIRKLYREYQFQSGGKPAWTEDAPAPPDARTQNGVILTSMRHDRNHNDLWQEGWKIGKNYGILIAALFQAFSEENASIGDQFEQVTQLYKQAAGEPLPSQASAVKVYLPTAVQGVNRVKADSNKVDPQKADWLSLWLIAGGLFHYGVSERVKVAERVYDWRVTALDPEDIQLSKYRIVLDSLRKYNPPGGGHGIARFDAELVLKFCQALLNHHQAQADSQPADELEIWEPVNHFAGRFKGTHFGQKGQVYGVKELFTLGLPAWINPDNSQDLLDYQTVLSEHLSVISSLSSEEGHSELLAAYRDFITGSHLSSFFRFQVSYADYTVKRLADGKARPPRLFTVTGLNIMTKKEESFTKITRDPSFLRIAKAINQATVYAGKVKTKDGTIELDWQRKYGLAQQLSSQSGSKKEFLSAIANFLADYEAENLRLSEKLQNQGKSLKRIWPKKQDLDRLIELIEQFDTVLVANLLVAYGYASWREAKDEAQNSAADESSEMTASVDELEDIEIEGDVDHE